jgi:hypothetical protein
MPTSEAVLNHRLELTRTYNRQGVAAVSCLLLLLEKRLPGTRAAGFFLQETSDTPFIRLSIDPLFMFYVVERSKQHAIRLWQKSAIPPLLVPFSVNDQLMSFR